MDKFVSDKKFKKQIKVIKKNTQFLNKRIDTEINSAFKFAFKSKFKKLENWEHLNLPDQNNFKIKISELDDVSYSKKDTMPEPY